MFATNETITNRIAAIIEIASYPVRGKIQSADEYKLNSFCSNHL